MASASSPCVSAWFTTQIVAIIDKQSIENIHEFWTRIAAKMWRVVLLLLTCSLFIVIVCAYDEVSCYRDTSSLIPTTFFACYQIIKSLVRDENPDISYHFSRRPGQGYRLPESWMAGNCLLRLDAHSDDDTDTFTFRDVASEAASVLLACVAKPPHLGGTQYVGPKAVINVTVFGFDAASHSTLLLPTMNGSVLNASNI